MSGKDQIKKVTIANTSAEEGVNGNLKAATNPERGNRWQKFKSGAIKSLATILLAASVNHAIAQKPVRSSTKRTNTPGKVVKTPRVVDSTKTTSTVVK